MVNQTCKCKSCIINQSVNFLKFQHFFSELLSDFTKSYNLLAQFNLLLNDEEGTQVYTTCQQSNYNFSQNSAFFSKFLVVLIKRYNLLAPSNLLLNGEGDMQMYIPF